MINLHSFRKSGSMCSVVGKNHGGTVVKPASVGPMGAGGQEAKRLRRSEAEAADPESDNGDVGSEGSSSTKGDKGRQSVGRQGLLPQIIFCDVCLVNRGKPLEVFDILTGSLPCRQINFLLVR